MASHLVTLIDNPGKVKRHIPASPQELEALKTKLIHGHQTEDADHNIICSLLNLSLVVHNLPNYDCYHAVDCGSEADVMHVLFTRRADEAGNVEGHFDLLLPYNPADTPVPSPPVDKESDPGSVTQAITVRGVETAAALLSIDKEVENRTFCLEGSWYALHVGKTEAESHFKQFLNDVVPHLDTEGLTKGMIVGLIYVRESVPLQEHRQSVGCTSSCVFPSEPGKYPAHVDGCAMSKHAFGPILNFIGHAIRFEKPFAASGKLGKWPLSTGYLKTIKGILSEKSYTRCSAEARDTPQRLCLGALSASRSLAASKKMCTYCTLFSIYAYI